MFSSVRNKSSRIKKVEADLRVSVKIRAWQRERVEPQGYRIDLKSHGPG